MIRAVRDIRLIPVALVASACLLVLTMTDLLFDGGQWLTAGPPPPDGKVVIHAAPDAPPPPGTKLSWAQEVFGFPGASGQAPPADIVPSIDAADAARAKAAADSADITGSIATKPAIGKTSGAALVRPAGSSGKRNKNGDAALPIAGKVLCADGATLATGAKVAILERLEKRREQLDTRARALDIRQNLVKAAEKRIAAQLADIKEIQASIAAEKHENNEAGAARFKALVTMYENMKARDAAKIFDGLEMPVLLKVVGRIKPRIMADIMAQMSPQIAERLTVKMASEAQAKGNNGAAALPKIEGHPTAP